MSNQQARTALQTDRNVSNYPKPEVHYHTGVKGQLLQNQKATSQVVGTSNGHQINRQSTIYPITVPQPPACAFHPTYHLTNFCGCSTCLLPLCPSCIKIHTHEHIALKTQPNYEDIRQIIDNVVGQVGQLKGELENVQSQLNGQIDYVMDQQQSLILTTISLLETTLTKSIHKHLQSHTNTLITQLTTHPLLKHAQSTLNNVQRHQQVLGHTARQIGLPEHKIMRLIIKWYAGMVGQGLEGVIKGGVDAVGGMKRMREKGWIGVGVSNGVKGDLLNGAIDQRSNNNQKQTITNSLSSYQNHSNISPTLPQQTIQSITTFIDDQISTLLTNLVSNVIQIDNSPSLTQQLQQPLTNQIPQQHQLYLSSLPNLLNKIRDLSHSVQDQQRQIRKSIGEIMGGKKDGDRGKVHGDKKSSKDRRDNGSYNIESNHNGSHNNDISFSNVNSDTMEIRFTNNISSNHQNHLPNTLTNGNRSIHSACSTLDNPSTSHYPSQSHQRIESTSANRGISLVLRSNYTKNGTIQRRRSETIQKYSSKLQTIAYQNNKLSHYNPNNQHGNVSYHNRHTKSVQLSSDLLIDAQNSNTFELNRRHSLTNQQNIQSMSSSMLTPVMSMQLGLQGSQCGNKVKYNNNNNNSNNNLSPHSRPNQIQPKPLTPLQTNGFLSIASNIVGLSTKQTPINSSCLPNHSRYDQPTSSSVSFQQHSDQNGGAIWSRRCLGGRSRKRY